MWRVIPVDAETGHALHAEQPGSYEDLPRNGAVLVTMGPFQAHGVFRAMALSGAGTTTLATPPPGGSLLITDLVVSAKKVSSTTLVIEFSDGVNTEVILAPDTVNQSTNFAWSPVGRIQGWEDALLRVITTGANTDAIVTVGYVKNPLSIVHTEWDALR